MAVRNLEQHATLYATLLGIVALALDYVTGPYIRFPILFVFPVVIASWYRHWYVGMGFAVSLSSISLGLAWHWIPEMPQTLIESGVNAAIRVVVLGALAYFTTMHRALQQQVRVLSGILPICSFCKRIQDRYGNWQALEGYIRQHSEADFSHGFCPSCTQEHYGDFLRPQGGSQQTS